MNIEWYLKLDGEIRKFIETGTTISLVMNDGSLQVLLIKGGISGFRHCPINCKEDLVVALAGTFQVEDLGC